MAPSDPTTLPFSAAQAMVDAIWSDMGLRYAPAVGPLPRQARSTIASADRLSILLADRTPSWCLLHARRSSFGRNPDALAAYVTSARADSRHQSIQPEKSGDGGCGVNRRWFDEAAPESHVFVDGIGMRQIRQ